MKNSMQMVIHLNILIAVLHIDLFDIFSQMAFLDIFKDKFVLTMNSVHLVQGSGPYFPHLQ